MADEKPAFGVILDFDNDCEAEHCDDRCQAKSSIDGDRCEEFSIALLTIGRVDDSAIDEHKTVSSHLCSQHIPLLLEMSFNELRHDLTEFMMREHPSVFISAILNLSDHLKEKMKSDE